MGWHHLWATRLTQSQVRWQSINYYTGYYYFECKKVNSSKKVKIYFYKKWSVAELRMAGAKKLSSCSLHPIFPLHFVSRYFHFIHSFTTPTLLIPFGPHVCFSLTSHVSSNSFFTALFFFVTFCMSLSYPCSFYTHLSFCSSKSSPLLFVSLQPSLFLCDSNSFFQNHFLCDSDSVLNTTFFLSLFPSTVIYLFVLLILLPFSLSLRLYR